MEVLPKPIMLSGWNKIALCIRTRDISYLCKLYVKLGNLQEGGRETLSQRLTTNSYYVFVASKISGAEVRIGKVK